MSHKFRLHQRVRILRTGGSAPGGSSSGGGSWEVVRLLPADETGEFHYRVKADGTERAASESDLEAA